MRNSEQWTTGHVDKRRVGPVGLCTVSRSLRYDGVAVVMTLYVISAVCTQAAAGLAANVTFAAMAVMECTGLTVSQHVPHSSVHAVADPWRRLSSRTARRCNNLTMTVSGYKPKFEQWKMAAGGEYAVMSISGSCRT